MLNTKKINTLLINIAAMTVLFNETVERIEQHQTVGFPTDALYERAIEYEEQIKRWRAKLSE
jgi:hypothetical protein